jgi:autotransporter-associated beta strand protein
MRSPRRFITALVIPAALCALAPAAFAQTNHTWIGPNGGAWDTAAHWSTGIVPDSGDDSVILNNSATAPSTMGIGLGVSPITVRGIAASNASPYSASLLGDSADPSARSLALLDNVSVWPSVSVDSGLLQIGASLTAGQGFLKTGKGALLLAGPVGAKIITVGEGRLDIVGANSCNDLNCRLAPPIATHDTTFETNLRLSGISALPAQSYLSFYLGNQTLSNSTLRAAVDLGGLHRDFSIISLHNSPFFSGQTDSTAIIDIRNGSLATNSLSRLDLSSSGSGMNLELWLPDSSTVSSATLSVGNGSASSAAKISVGKVRIGTTSDLRLRSLYMGYNGSSGRIEARAPGSTLTITGNTTTSRVSAIEIGNSSITPAGYDSGIDMETGTLHLLADRVNIRGASSAQAPAVASIRFGAGNVDITTLTLGYYAQHAFDHQCLVVQKGGDAKIQNLGFGAYLSNDSANRRTYRYQLHGGSLSLGNTSAYDNITYGGFVSRGINWSAGTLKNYPGRSSAIFVTAKSPVLAPLDLSLAGSDPHLLEIETGRSFTLGVGSRLNSDSPAVHLTKIGNGTLVLAGDSAGFSGALRFHAGTLALGESSALFHAPLGALRWNAGTLAFDLSATDQSSDRIILTRSLSKGAGPASGRVIDLKSSPGNGTYTLATYASTDLTLADFTVTGVASGCSADFTVGPAALTVTLAPATAFTTWRSSKFASATNLGDAADTADPDADGRPNLLEYALGTEPLASDPGQPIAIAADTAADRLTLTFSRIADPALTYAVRAADDPSGPWSGESAETVFASTGADNLAGPVTAADSVPLSVHPRRFLRLVVSRG